MEVARIAYLQRIILIVIGGEHGLITENYINITLIEHMNEFMSNKY